WRSGSHPQAPAPTHSPGAGGHTPAPVYRRCGMMKWFDHYRGTAAAVLAGLLVSILAIGCQPKIDSPLSGEKVTPGRYQLEAQTEAAAILADGRALEQRAAKLE